jgi:hypothetical protein
MHARQSLLRTGNRHGPVSPQKLESEEFGTPPYPAKTAPSEVRNVFEYTLLQPPAS